MKTDYAEKATEREMQLREQVETLENDFNKEEKTTSG